MALFRGVGVLPVKQPSATTSMTQDTITLQCTLGYKPTITLIVDTIVPNIPAVSVPTTVTVTSSVTNFTTQNQTGTATAVVRDQHGSIMTSGYVLAWSSGQPSIVSVTPSNPSPFNQATLTCLATNGNGGVTITAKVVGSSNPVVSGNVVVTTPVQQATTLLLSPNTLTINDALVHFLTPTMRDQFGATMPVGTLTWASSDSTGKITVSVSGGVVATAGSTVATITATSPFGPSGTASVTSGVAVLTALLLSPGNATLVSGQITEVPTQVDQFNAPFPVAGGGASLTFNTAAGIGLDSNVAALAAGTTYAVVIRMRVDEWTAVSGSGIQFGVLNVDNGTVSLATTRLTVYLQGSTGGPYIATLRAPGVGGISTGNIPLSSMPPNGSDIVIYGVWQGAGTQLQRISVYTGNGTNTLIDPNATATTNAFDGPPQTVASGGQVRVNKSQFTGTQETCRYQGVALYTAQRAAGSEDTKPTVGDANLAYLCQFSDATSGTTPSTATTQFGGTGLVLTPGDFVWSTDASAGGWNGGAVVTYTFSSSVPSVATVNSSTGVVTAGVVGQTTVQATYVQQPAIKGSAVITVSATAIPTFLVMSPTSTTINGAGSVAQITPIVQDQNHNPMSGVTVNLTSANPSDVTVTASVVTPNFATATWAAVGGPTNITATAVGGSNPSGVCAVTTIANNFHMPGGMTIAVQTGRMTALPTLSVPPIGGQWAMLSPSTPTSTGDWSGNLTVVPPPDTGMRVNYPTNIVGGNESVRFLPFTLSTYGTGVGFLYVRDRIRYAPNFTNSGNVGTKFWYYHQNPANADLTNHLTLGFVDTTTGNGTPGDGFVTTTTQFVTHPFANYPTDYYNHPFLNIGAANRGTWFYVEILFTPQSNSSNSDGQYDNWIMDGNGVTTLGHINVTGAIWVAPPAGQDLTWRQVYYDGVYGGGTNSPAVATYIDYDDVVIAAK